MYISYELDCKTFDDDADKCCNFVQSAGLIIKFDTFLGLP